MRHRKSQKTISKETDSKGYFKSKTEVKYKISILRQKSIID